MTNSLTAYEMNLVVDAEVLLTKNRIILKVQQLFAELIEKYKAVLQTAPALLVEKAPKISKGENYKGLPYVVLDFPRLFGKEDIFAIRTFFWWGNFFSVTLYLSGQHQKQHAEAIEKAIASKLFDDWFISLSTNPWEHHFEEDNYSAIRSANTYNLPNFPFVKIAKKIPLNKWEEVEDYCKENFSFLIQVLQS